MSARLLWGRPCANGIYAEIIPKLQGKTLCTIGFDEPKWTQYSDSLCKGAKRIGVGCRQITLKNEVSSKKFIEVIDEVSEDRYVNGILVQQPLPSKYHCILSHINLNKDVDCCNPIAVANLYAGCADVSPATPTAVIKLLQFYGIELAGRHVVIIGRGNAVGKPLIHLALAANATVTVCHTKTVNLPSICHSADILVSACGVAGLITEEYVTENTVAVDVGLSFIDGKTCGDFSDYAQQKCAAASPVPGGIGPVTRAVLFENLCKLVR